MKLEDLTEVERKTYEFIQKVGEIQPKNLPDRRMVGAVANLKAKGFVVIFKKYMGGFRREPHANLRNPYQTRRKKKKFVRISTKTG
jgi:hypothetical protein